MLPTVYAVQLNTSGKKICGISIFFLGYRIGQSTYYRRLKALFQGSENQQGSFLVANQVKAEIWYEMKFCQPKAETVQYFQESE